jgi:hypothetical protein
MQQPPRVRAPTVWVVFGALLVLLLGSVLADGLALRAEPEAAYRLTQSVRGGSGGIRHSPRYQLADTSGQVTGPTQQSSTRYRLTSGFWGMTEFSPAPRPTPVYDRFGYLPIVEVHR